MSEKPDDVWRMLAKIDDISAVKRMFVIRDCDYWRILKAARFVAISLLMSMAINVVLIVVAWGLL